MPVLINDNDFNLSTAPLLTFKDATANATRYILIQFRGALAKANVQELNQRKVTLDEFVGDETYLATFDVKADASILTAGTIPALGFVKIVTAFPKELKVRALLAEDIKAKMNGGGGKELLTLLLGLHKAAVPKIEDVKREVVSIPQSEVAIDGGKVSLTVKLPTEQVARLIAIEGIRSIGQSDVITLQSEYARQILHVDEAVLLDAAAVAAITAVAPGLATTTTTTTTTGSTTLAPTSAPVPVPVPIPVPAPANTNTAGLDGAGQIITVADSGFDKGNINDVHPAFQGRVVDFLHATSTGDHQSKDQTGHGTHVAGCAVGNGRLANNGPLVRGTAPGARLLVEGINNLINDKIESLNPSFLLDMGVDRDSYIHNWSWNAKGAGGYTEQSRQVDERLAAKPGLTLCVAAGNEGMQWESRLLMREYCVSSAAAAKNAITVGASGTTRPLAQSTGKPDVNGIAGNPDSIASFSTKGGGKSSLKPDVVAPGVAILSAASRDPEFQTGTTSTRLASGSTPDNNYCFQSGTSMAAPMVTGCVAVLRQAFYRHHSALAVTDMYGQVKYPRSDLFKALLINSAVDIVGGKYQGKPIGPAPNIIQGYGRVDLEHSIMPLLPTQSLSGFFNGLVTDVGPANQSSHPPISSPALRTPNVRGDATATFELKATLVWLDGAGTVLQHALSLKVRIGTAAPVVFSSLKANDNVIKAIVPAVPKETDIRFEVEAARVLGQQTYSLAWSFKLRA